MGEKVGAHAYDEQIAVDASYRGAINHGDNQETQVWDDRGYFPVQETVPRTDHLCMAN